MKNKIVHIIPHSHWDREWYLPLEIHRARLIEHIDNVLTLLEKIPEYTYHLDGQMIAIEDYLMFRPEKRSAIEHFVRENRLHIGPWYVLQDEFLTSGEANVRNLLYGTALAQCFGKVCRIGYLPDAFGNAGQMPQLFAQAELQAAAFGRGVTPDDKHPCPEKHFPRYSEFIWQSPDGSTIPALFFAGWYNNAQEIPADPSEAKQYWDKRLEHANRFASSRHLLFLNGADHEPVQKNLDEALETARKIYPDIAFICSDFENYVSNVLKDRESIPETVSGELAGQESDGTNTLCNTASTHAPLKLLNRRNESLLSQKAEPVMAMAALAGMEIDNVLLHRAWKLLLQNHPHDSICSCGIDAVNREVRGRFEKSIQLGEFIIQKAGDYLATQIAAPKLADNRAAFAVVNPTGWERTSVITVTVPIKRIYGTRDARAALMETEDKTFRLIDFHGHEVSASYEFPGVHFGYELPDDSFRKPYFERQIQVTFTAKDIPPFGYAVYYLEPGEPVVNHNLMRTGMYSMENRFISVRINADGTFDLTNKKTNRTYKGMGCFEDVGDVGDEYFFREASGEPIYSTAAESKIVCEENNADRIRYMISQVFNIPLCADRKLQEEYEIMSRRLNRCVERSSIMIPFRVTTTLTLEKDSPMLFIHTEFENNARDHRLRMLFPTDFSTETHLADAVFDVVERLDIPGENWQNPSRCQRMQYFAAAEDVKEGLAVINRGNYEYEILPERKQIAVTLLRSVGELGDWGVFPTPEAQCLSLITADLALLPYAGESFRENGCREAVQFQTDMLTFPITDSAGVFPEYGSFLSCSGEGLAVTTLKPAEDGRAIILRVCNVMEKETDWKVEISRSYKCFSSNIMETKGKSVSANENGAVNVLVQKKEIKTVRIEEY